MASAEHHRPHGTGAHAERDGNHAPLRDVACLDVYGGLCCCANGVFDGSEQCQLEGDPEMFNCGTTNRYCTSGCYAGDDASCTNGPPPGVTSPPVCYPMSTTRHTEHA